MLSGSAVADGWQDFCRGEEAGEVAAWGGVDRLILTHIGVLTNPEQSVDEASGAFAGRIDYAKQGTVFDL